MAVGAKTDFVALLKMMSTHYKALKAESYIKMYKNNDVGNGEVLYLVYGMFRFNLMEVQNGRNK